MMASFAKTKVIAVDYRMPPDFPYPAAMDDAMAVWREVVKTTNPRNIAIFGTSTGGGMTLAMVLRAKKEGLPLPAATAPGTPWSDLTKTGDTYFTNEQVDNVLVSNDGWLGDAAKLYANGHDLKDPMLSPVYGDYRGFPPSILTSGTRDLFLSNTVRVHRKMRAAGVEAALNVFEGQSHAQYAGDPSAPETKEYFDEVTRFFDKHLGEDRRSSSRDHALKDLRKVGCLRARIGAPQATSKSAGKSLKAAEADVLDHIVIFCRLDVTVGIFLQQEPILHQLDRCLLNRQYEPGWVDVPFFK